MLYFSKQMSTGTGDEFDSYESTNQTTTRVTFRHRGLELRLGVRVVFRVRYVTALHITQMVVMGLCNYTAC